MNRYVAVVPVKAESERVSRKNFRDFAHGQSLFDRKIQQLVASGVFAEIYVSTDSHELLSAGVQEEFRPIERAEALCNNVTKWSSVISGVLESIPEPAETTVCWAHVTVPFFTDYARAVEVYSQNQASGVSNGLVAVTRVDEFIISPEGKPVNYSWGDAHPYSQSLPNFMSVSGAFFFLSLGEGKRLNYLISSEPSFYVTSQQEAVDIDTEIDFEFAQFLARREP